MKKTINPFVLRKVLQFGFDLAVVALYVFMCIAIISCWLYVFFGTPVKPYEIIEL